MTQPSEGESRGGRGSRVEVYEREFVPVWGAPVADALLSLWPEEVLTRQRAVLVAQARTGYLAKRLSEVLPGGGKLMVVDSSKELLEGARTRLVGAAQGVFYSVQALNKLSYAEHVFGAVFCDSALLTKGDLRLAGRELVRVLKPEGWLAVAVPLVDTFRCFPDMLLEAAERRNMADVVRSVQNFMAVLPTEAGLEGAFQEAGLGVEAQKIVRFSVSFEDAEQFLFSPFVDHLHLPRWMAICNKDEQREPLFFDVVQSLNTYFAGLPFRCEVEVACVLAKRLEERV